MANGFSSMLFWNVFQQRSRLTDGGKADSAGLKLIGNASKRFRILPDDLNAFRLGRKILVTPFQIVSLIQINVKR